MAGYPFNPMGGALGGQQQMGGVLGGGGWQQLLDPSVALPTAAALMGGRNLQESLSGAFAAAGPGMVASKKRMAVNDWMKAGMPKDVKHPATLKLFDAAPEIAQAYIGGQLGGQSNEGMTNTIKAYDAKSGVTKIMGWNPQSRRYDIEAGIAPPASGMSLKYNPDTGELEMLQGEGVTSGSGKLPLNRGAATETQKDIDPLERQKQQVEHIGDLYDPSYLTYEGKITTAKNRFLDKLGMAGEEDKKQLKGATRFKQNVEQVFNAYRKDITGAAAALAELDRLKQSVINTDQSPAEFEAAMGEFAAGLQRGLDIKKQLLREGIQLGSTQFSKEFDRRFMGDVDQSQAAPTLGASSGGAPPAESGWTDLGNGVRIRKVQ